MKANIQIEESWKKLLYDEFHQEYMIKLKAFLQSEVEQKKIIYPPGKEVFSAFNHTPFDQVKVVIIGQDPYHGPNQAHGMCFSVKPGTPPPPSLVNIFKELQTDLGIPVSTHGYLVHWADQGVLLLNAILTVEKSRPLSHQNKGWEIFTDKVVQLLNTQREQLVFLLWGSPAQKKGSIVDPKRHLVLKAPHPSPLSAHRGFLGCRHFSQVNRYLQQTGRSPIDWQLPLYTATATLQRPMNA